MGSIERQLASAGGVQKVVHATAEAMGARARAILAGHRSSGDARIVVDNSGVDSEVILEDPASLSINYGRGAYTRADGHHVGAAEGIHVIERCVRG